MIKLEVHGQKTKEEKKSVTFLTHYPGVPGFDSRWSTCMHFQRLFDEILSWLFWNWIYHTCHTALYWMSNYETDHVLYGGFELRWTGHMQISIKLNDRRITYIQCIYMYIWTWTFRQTHFSLFKFKSGLWHIRIGELFVFLTRYVFNIYISFTPLRQ